MGSMILFILWMCYCCRWKDNKFDATACADRPQPFWIDVNSNAYYEALQWSLHQVIILLIIIVGTRKEIEKLNFITRFGKFSNAVCGTTL